MSLTVRRLDILCQFLVVLEGTMQEAEDLYLVRRVSIQVQW